MKTSLALLFIVGAVGTLGAQESASPGQTEQLFSITITPLREEVKSGSAEAQPDVPHCADRQRILTLRDQPILQRAPGQPQMLFDLHV
jgi:hypothetical protein